jgi:4'-phosphopantetheinyl transferase
MVARAALRAILGRYLGMPPADLCFATGAFGKPALCGAAAASDIRFNASRSDHLALVAVTRSREIGVDIERVRAGVDVEGIARQWLTPADTRHLLALGPEARVPAFFRCWCRREAVVKAAGVGLAAEPDVSMSGVDLGAWSVSSIAIDPGFMAALAVDGHIGRIIRFCDPGPHGTEGD